MDLSDNWHDTNGDGMFDQIPREPEPSIWIGRLTAGTLYGNEIDLLKNYFAKNHKYRIGELNVIDRAMAYVDDAWIPKGNCGLKSAYNDVTLVNDKFATNAADYKSRLAEDYEFIHVVVHSTSTEHNFEIDFAPDGSVTIWTY